VTVVRSTPGRFELRQPALSVRRVDPGVVVTATGRLDESARERLARVLEDLIDGQGNRAVSVELPDATAIELETLDVLVQAAERAAARRGTFTARTAQGEWSWPG
jgi:anti-anti-sigma regulatory factor